MFSLCWLFGASRSPRLLHSLSLGFNYPSPCARGVGSLPVVPRCALPGQAGFGGYAVLRTVTMLNSYAAP